MGDSSAEALVRQAELDAMRQMSQQLGNQARLLEKLSDQVVETNIRVTRLEEQRVTKQVDELQNALNTAFRRIDQLESQRDKALGLRDAGAWIAQKAPWLIAGISSFLAWLGYKQH